MCANALSCGPSADHRQVLLKSYVALEISRNGSTIPFGIAHHFVSFSVSEIHYLRRIPRLRQRRLRQKRLRQKKAATKGVPRVQLRFQWAFSKQKACVRSLSPPCRTRAVPYMWVARGRLEMLATRALRVAE